MRTAIVLLTDGTKTELSGATIDQLYAYFRQPTSVQPPVGWVTSGNISVNFNHVIQITFKEAE